METWRTKQGLRTPHRMLVGSSFVVASLLMVSLLIWHHFGTKQIVLTINGERQVVETRQETVQGMLEELEIPYKVHDRLTKRLSQRLSSGDVIELTHTYPVTLKVEGEKRVTYTAGKNVQEVIEESGIALKSNDKVIPELTAKVKEGDQIEIIRVTKSSEIREETIPVKTVKIEDNNLVAGKETVLQPGREGLREIIVEKRYENGKLADTTVVSEEVLLESEDRIVAVGTRKPVAILSASAPNVEMVTKGDMTFGVKKILENVTLTAYDAGLKSTGKTREHPQYGITYTGTTVKEGHTVAVDPDVIPLGWWIYIDGIGLRKAEDIGSAIKGKKIDIYMDSEEEANKFGVKRGYKVYIIGPNKPDTA